MPTLSDVLTNSGIFAAGYLSAGYTAGFNKGNSFSGRVFETVGSANTFELNQAALLLVHAPDQGFGFKLLTIAGTDAKLLNIFYGTDPNDFALFIAQISYAYGPLTISGGRFPALSGYELAPIALNDNISRSLVLALAQPVPLTGVRATYKVTDTLTGVVTVSNSDVIDGTTAAAATDDNKQKSIEFGGSWAPVKAFKLAIYDYIGTESQANGGKNNILDLVATFAATDALSFALNGDYFRTYDDTVPGGLHLFAGPPTTRAGAAGYVIYKFAPQWTGTLRAEYLHTKQDPSEVNGTPESSNNLSELTATMRYTATKNFRILGELRGDRATRPFFANGVDGGVQQFAKYDSEVRVNAIYSFGGL
jgi:hypothetical protein